MRESQGSCYLDPQNLTAPAELLRVAILRIQICTRISIHAFAPYYQGRPRVLQKVTFKTVGIDHPTNSWLILASIFLLLETLRHRGKLLSDQGYQLLDGPVRSAPTFCMVLVVYSPTVPRQQLVLAYRVVTVN